MPEIETILIVTLVVFGARLLESIIGFGGTVMALPVLAMLTPGLEIKSTLVPVLALGNIVCCIGIVWVGRGAIVWAEFMKIIGWMALGLPVGFLVGGYASEVLLRFILGIFVLGVAIFSLVRGNRHATTANPDGRLRQFYLRTVVVGAGVIHGIFTTGGPLLVVYATRVLKTKGLFRVTLAMVWLTLNLVMVAGWMADQRIAAEAWPLAGLTIPFIIAAVAIGDNLHHRLDEAAFRKVAYVVLLITGCSLLYKVVPELLSHAM
jgi:uncharacterized protein